MKVEKTNAAAKAVEFEALKNNEKISTSPGSVFEDKTKEENSMPVFKNDFENVLTVYDILNSGENEENKPRGSKHIKETPEYRFEIGSLPKAKAKAVELENDNSLNVSFGYGSQQEKVGVVREIIIKTNKEENQKTTDEQSFSKDIESSKQTETEYATAGVISSKAAQEAAQAAAEEEKRLLALMPDGVIGNFSQGKGSGDCWLLASLESLSNTPSGRQIIKNAVQINEDNTYTVSLRGIGANYTISQEEINSRTRLSGGDNDVRLIEIAAEKALYDIKDGRLSLGAGAPSMIEADDINGVNKSPIVGGWPQDLLYMMTGSTPNRAWVNETSCYDEGTRNNLFNNIDAMIEAKGRNPNTWATVCFSYILNPETGEGVTKNGKPAIQTVNGATVSVTDNGEAHAWAIDSVNLEQGTVTMVNPWNSGQKVTVNREALKQYVYEVEYLELP